MADKEMEFDKFMKDICRREDIAKDRAKNLSESDDKDVLPQRRFNRLYRERPQNRIRWVKK